MSKNSFIFIFVGVLFFAASTTARAQDEATISERGTSDLSFTTEQQLELRGKILELFGIPKDTPLSIFDIMKGNPLGFNLQQNIEQTTRTLEIVPVGDSTAPGTKIDLLAVSAGINLRESTITWYRNNKVELSGPSAVSFSFTTGSIGSADRIRIVVKTPEGGTREATRTIYPAKAYLSWDADSYTPSWYRGKALPIPGAKITVRANPHARINGATLNPASFSYEWEVDGRPLVPLTRGASSAAITTSSYASAPLNVSVRIVDSQNRIDHTEHIMIELHQPLILMYEKDPLFGLLTARTADIVRTKPGNAKVIQFEPFFIPNEEIRTTQYTWVFNGTDAQKTDFNDRLLRITTPESSTDVQQISMRYEQRMSALRRGESSPIRILVEKQ